MGCAGKIAKMTKTAQLKDTVAKIYLQDLELVADLFNVFIFKGRRRLSADMLRPFPTEDNSVIEDADGLRRAETQRRDASYLAYTDGKAMYYLCIEVQSGADWTMPLRVMRYDAAKYQYQVDNCSGLRRGGLLPVFTLVLNFGKGRWKGPRSLHEMMSPLDDDAKEAVPNYRINIVDPYDMNEKTLNMLCTEIKDVLTYFRASTDRGGFAGFLNGKHEVTLSDKAILLLNTYLHTELESQANGRRTRMCVAWKDFKEKAIAQGIRKGRKEGLEQGIEKGYAEFQERALEEALKRNLDYDTIMAITGLPLEKIEKKALSL